MVSENFVKETILLKVEVNAIWTDFVAARNYRVGRQFHEKNGESELKIISKTKSSIIAQNPSLVGW